MYEHETTKHGNKVSLNLPFSASLSLSRSLSLSLARMHAALANQAIEGNLIASLKCFHLKSHSKLPPTGRKLKVFLDTHKICTFQCLFQKLNIQNKIHLLTFNIRKWIFALFVCSILYPIQKY